VLSDRKTEICCVKLNDIKYKLTYLLNDDKMKLLKTETETVTETVPNTL